MLRMNLFEFAYRLGKTIEEIEAISLQEYYEWLLFFNYKEKKHGDETRSKNSLKSSR